MGDPPPYPCCLCGREACTCYPAFHEPVDASDLCPICHGCPGVCESWVELDDRIRAHLQFNFFPRADSQANVDVAHLAIEAFLAGRYDAPISGANGDRAGQVIDNLRLDG